LIRRLHSSIATPNTNTIGATGMPLQKPAMGID
jgi:hypothetical protein